MVHREFDEGWAVTVVIVLVIAVIVYAILTYF